MFFGTEQLIHIHIAKKLGSPNIPRFYNNKCFSPPAPGRRPTNPWTQAHQPLDAGPPTPGRSITNPWTQRHQPRGSFLKINFASFFFVCFFQTILGLGPIIMLLSEYIFYHFLLNYPLTLMISLKCGMCSQRDHLYIVFLVQNLGANIHFEQ